VCDGSKPGKLLNNRQPSLVPKFLVALDQAPVTATPSVCFEDVEGDYAGAAIWFRMAASSRIPLHRIGLGLLCLDGRGLAQDYAEAHFWFDAVAVGTLTDSVRQYAVENREICSLSHATVLEHDLPLFVHRLTNKALA
jgi:hypothetical protein